MTANLSAADLSVLSQASAAGVLRHGEWIARYSVSKRWLGIDNVYKRDPIARIKSDRSGSTVMNSKHLAEYIVASVPLHLLDGWNYLGQAFSAQVRGLPSVATHLAYYAELRAAMALLASQGIGVFNQRHFVVDSGGSLLGLDARPTHQAVWLYLQHWAKSPDAGELVGRVIRPEGVPLSDWVAEMSYANTWTPIGTELLLGMGLDLRRMADDRGARNQVSYRPTNIDYHNQASANAKASFLSQAVRVLEPSGTGGSFEALDKYVLRRTAEMAFKASTDNTPTQAIKQYREAISSMLRGTVESTSSAERLCDFLLRDVSADEPLLLSEAAKDDVSHHPSHHLQVLGRASLLLRVATGATRGLLLSVGLRIEDNRFWWVTRGHDQGLWPLSEPEQMADLWDDVAQALDDIDEWCASDGSPHGLLHDCAIPLYEATSLSRVALLGLAS